MAPNALIMINRDGFIELVNASAETIFGFHRNELVGQSLDILLPERMRSVHQSHRATFFNNPEHRSMGAGRELFALHKNGSEFPVEIGLNPIQFNGQIHVVAAIVDITERKTLERTILKTNERFTMAANAAGIGFWNWNIETNTLNWDDWMFKLYGSEIALKEQAYTVWRDHLHPEDKLRAEQELMDAVANVKPFDTEFRIIKTSGEICYIKAFAHILRAPDGSPIEMFGLNMDITARMLAEQNQQRLVSDLKEINEELNNFTYVASHDLKSPLRGIDQLAKWITEDIGDQLDPSTNEHLRLMRSRIKRMEILLDDLLTYSRIGRSKDPLVHVDTQNLVMEIFELVSLNSPINLKCITFMPIIQTAKVPLELVFRNLISNSIKHNSNKTDLCIEIGATPLENGYEFYVRDNGAGVLPEYHERIFGMFQKLKSRDEVEGSGIGLAIVKKIIESYDGDVKIISDGITGCEFRFSWPLNAIKGPL
jgi:PAS domain S-box-containing protein